MKDPKLESLKPTEMVQYFLKEVQLQKCQDNKKASLLTKRQKMSSQMPLRKTLRRKDIRLNSFLMQMKVLYSGLGGGAADATKDIY